MRSLAKTIVLVILAVSACGGGGTSVAVGVTADAIQPVDPSYLAMAAVAERFEGLVGPTNDITISIRSVGVEVPEFPTLSDTQIIGISAEYSTHEGGGIAERMVSATFLTQPTAETVVASYRQGFEEVVLEPSRTGSSVGHYGETETVSELVGVFSIEASESPDALYDISSNAWVIDAENVDNGGLTLGILREGVFSGVEVTDPAEVEQALEIVAADPFAGHGTLRSVRVSASEGLRQVEFVTEGIENDSTLRDQVAAARGWVLTDESTEWKNSYSVPGIPSLRVESELWGESIFGDDPAVATTFVFDAPE